MSSLSKQELKRLQNQIVILEKALKFVDKKDKLDFDRSIIQSEFMDCIYELMKERNNMNKKELASELQTTASYITQLFNGNKKMNFDLVAKLQQVFETKFRLREQKETKLVSIISPNIENTYKRSSTDTFKVNVEEEAVGMY